jgi:hypothetical protein
VAQRDLVDLFLYRAGVGIDQNLAFGHSVTPRHMSRPGAIKRAWLARIINLRHGRGLVHEGSRNVPGVRAWQSFSRSIRRRLARPP